MSHFIHEVEITNFKSIRHQKIEGCKRINVFIGYPNVGKSNVLEALSSIQLLEDRHRDSVHVSELIRLEDFFYLSFFDGNTQEPAIIQYAPDRRISVSYQAEGQLRFAQNVLEKDKGHSIPGDTWRIDGFKEFSIGRQFGDSGDVKETELPTVRKYIFESGQTFNLDWRYALRSPSGNNLFSIIESNPVLRKAFVNMLEPYGLKLSFDKRGNYALTVLKNLDDETIFLIPFHLVADTLQRLIFHKAAIASNKDSVLLFEEPEAHMFPPYISKFTADVMFDENGNQFFINTHSPFVINDFMENLKSDQLSIYVVGYKKHPGETVIRKLTDEELHEIYQYGIDIYYNLERYLEHEEQ